MQIRICYSCKTAKCSPVRFGLFAIIMYCAHFAAAPPAQVAMCGAVCGDALHYGKMDPYVNELVMHEHCYIRGPSGAHGEAIQLYAKIGQS